VPLSRSAREAVRGRRPCQHRRSRSASGLPPTPRADASARGRRVHSVADARASPPSRRSVVQPVSNTASPRPTRAVTTPRLSGSRWRTAVRVRVRVCGEGLELAMLALVTGDERRAPLPAMCRLLRPQRGMARRPGSRCARTRSPATADERARVLQRSTQRRVRCEGPRRLSQFGERVVMPGIGRCRAGASAPASGADDGSGRRCCGRSRHRAPTACPRSDPETPNRRLS
jgi:hypothetical protein